MPQAMPIYWMNLFLILTLIFMLIIIKMYYSNFKTPTDKNKITLKKNIIWKW